MVVVNPVAMVCLGGPGDGGRVVGGERAAVKVVVMELC